MRWLIGSLVYGMVWSREEKKEKEKAQRKQNYTIKEKITHDT